MTFQIFKKQDGKLQWFIIPQQSTHTKNCFPEKDYQEIIQMLLKY